MANTLRFKRGLVIGLPTGVAGEPLFTTDTFDLYIGTGAANQRYQKYIASGTTLQYLRGDGSLATFPTNIVTGTGVAGQVAYFTGTNTQTGSNNLFWDNTNSRLGIGLTTPLSSLHILSTATIPARFISSGALTSVIFDNTNANLWGCNIDVRVNGNTQFNFGTLGSILGNTNYDATIYSRAGNGFRVNVNNSTTTSFFVSSLGNTILNSVLDNGLRFQVTGDGYFSGSLGIGTSGLTGFSLRVAKNITGAATSYGVRSDGIVQSDVSGQAIGFDSSLGTQAAAFTLPVLSHYRADQSTFGAGSAVTTQYGFQVRSNLIGATNNYGFFGDIPSGTGRWNLYMNGTAANYLNGSLAVGTTTFNDNLNPYKSVIFYATSGSGGGGLMVTANQAANAANAMISSIQWGMSDGTKMKPSGYFFNYATLGQGNRAVSTNSNFIASTQVAAANLIITNNNAFINHTDLNSTSNDYVNYQAYLYVQRNSGTVNVNSYIGFLSRYQTGVGSETIGTIADFQASTSSLSANSLVTTRYGLLIDFNNTQVTNAWGVYQSQSTVNNYMNGALLIGTTTVGTFKLDVNGTMRVSGDASIITGGNAILNIDGLSTSTSGIIIKGSGTERGRISFSNSNNMRFFIGSGITQYLEIDATTRAATFSSSVTAASLVVSGTSTSSYIGSITQTNTTAGVSFGLLVKGGTNSSDVALNVQSAASANLFRVFGDGQVLLGASSSTIGAMNFIRTGTSPVASRLTFGTDGTGYSFAIGKNQGGTVTDLVTILDSGAANFSSSIQAATAIAIGTTPDTNKPFKILKNINATVGINFENTSTSSLAFSAIQMGTDVTGGTKFTNLVYASSGVVANGVYNPDGTSLINNGGGGLNFLGTPTRFYTGGSNGVLRLLFDNEGTTQFTATTPTTNAVDGYRQYSADVVAGNAAPHFRTENGAVIKLYQETTGVGNAIFSQGGGNAVLDDSTFAGYTLRQVVQALRNQGILA